MNGRAVFIAGVNHLKSKNAGCVVDDQGDGQGNCNQVRKAAATELVNFLATDPTGTGDPDILLLGDYNSYAKEEPIQIIEAGGRLPPLLVDQGAADKFLATQLNIDRLEAVCRAAGQPLTLRRHAGYDHGYFFIQSFVADHLRHHAAALA